MQAFSEISSQYPEDVVRSFIDVCNARGIDLKDDKQWKPVFHAQLRRQNIRPTKNERDKRYDD